MTENAGSGAVETDVVKVVVGHNGTTFVLNGIVMGYSSFPALNSIAVGVVVSKSFD